MARNSYITMALPKDNIRLICLCSTAFKDRAPMLSIMNYAQITSSCLIDAYTTHLRQMQGSTMLSLDGTVLHNSLPGYVSLITEQYVQAQVWNKLFRCVREYILVHAFHYMCVS